MVAVTARPDVCITDNSFKPLLDLAKIIKARQQSDLDLIKTIASIMRINSMLETTVGSGGITANLSPASSLSDKRSRQTFRGQENIRFQSGHLITGA